MKRNALLQVEKPLRYTGGETGTTSAEKAIRFVLAFPDVYEIGISNLGFQILYGIMKNSDFVRPERAYAPWPDMEELMRRDGIRLGSLESGAPLATADVVGFTLQYELSYTNILNMLSLAGIPLKAAERDETFPLVVAGGPCACNPEPLADFLDAVVLGDGEEAVLDVAETVKNAKQDRLPKRVLLEKLARIDGVYVPSLYDVTYDHTGRVAGVSAAPGVPARVSRRIVSDINKVAYPVEPVVPLLKAIHDRVSMEISRGCTRGCRFCQAGFIYRPVRERSPEQILQLIDETLRNTGYDEVSLLSLSTGDYSCLGGLLKALMARHAEQKVAVSLPSLRVGSLTQELVDEIKKVRKTGFTLAPEAATERLRQVINKTITEEELLRNAGEIYSAGWRLIKLYFMIGLPTETMDDVAAVSDLSKKVKREAKFSGGGEVNVSVSSFVPKPHTPFQWEKQISYEEILTKQEFLRDDLRKKKLNFKWQDAPLSVLEGVFARGDRRLSAVLLKAVESGCRFDGWGDHFRFDRWIKAFEAAGIDPLFYHRERAEDEILPWDHLDYGIKKQYLLAERAKAWQLAPTDDCRFGTCTGCGICDFKRVKPQMGEAVDDLPSPPAASSPADTEKIRIRFRKTGRMRYVSHLEMISLFTRAVRRARIPIAYSQGFHPHPKFSFATALSVGIESWAEFMDLDIAAGFGAERVRHDLNAALPEGMEVLEAALITKGSDSLSVIMDKTRYRVVLPAPPHDLSRMVAEFLARDTFPYRRVKEKKKDIDLDLRQELVELKTDGASLEMLVGRGKPLEFAAAVTGLSPTELADAEIYKLEVTFHS